MGQGRDDESRTRCDVWDGEEGTVWNGMHGPLDTGGSAWEGSPHNREELMAPCPGASWGEGGLHTGCLLAGQTILTDPGRCVRTMSHLSSSSRLLKSKPSSAGQLGEIISTLAQGRRGGLALADRLPAWGQTRGDSLGATVGVSSEPAGAAAYRRGHREAG